MEVLEESKSAAGFVYIDHIDKLRREQEELTGQVQALKENVATLRRLHWEAEQRSRHRWRISKVTAVMVTLLTLALVQETMDRFTQLTYALHHVAHPMNRAWIKQYQQKNIDHLMNPYLNASLVLGLPFLVIAVMLYLTNSACNEQTNFRGTTTDYEAEEEEEEDDGIPEEEDSFHGQVDNVGVEAMAAHGDNDADYID